MKLTLVWAGRGRSPSRATRPAEKVSMGVEVFPRATHSFRNWAASILLLLEAPPQRSLSCNRCTAAAPPTPDDSWERVRDQDIGRSIAPLCCGAYCALCCGLLHELACCRARQDRLFNCRGGSRSYKKRPSDGKKKNTMINHRAARVEV